MKKLLWILLAWIFGIALSIWSASAASSDCLNVKFYNWDSVCLGITKEWSKNFELSIDKNNLERGSSVRCYIVLPNNTMYTFNGCKGSFYYAWSDTDDVIVSSTYVTRNGNFYSKRMSTDVNFNKGTWASSSNTSSSSSSSSKNSDEIELSTNRKSPSTSQYVNLTIKTDKNYTGRLSLSAKYRSSSLSSWSSISNTSSTYFSDYSDEWDDGYYRMVSSDRGEITIWDIVKFKKSGYYRIYVEDTDGNESYIQFNVDTASSYDNNDELKVTASPSNPDTYEWINLTVKTDADYDARIKISKLQYKSSSSASWSTINNITSSTYISDYSSAWSDSYHRIVTDEDGKATLKNIVKFKKSGYYRIYVEDTDGNESYVQINVDTYSSSSSSNNNDEIELSTNRESPSTNQYVNLTIETDNDYVGKLTLSAKYRKSSSDSWSSISNTSSTYFSDYSDEWDDGYYRMTSSDDGEVVLKNLVKFKKSGYYRIYVEDTDGNESYIQFSVGEIDDEEEESSVDGFSVKELNTVKKVYKERNNMVWQMQRQYPSLKRDTYWIKLSENFYNDMKDVINNKRNRDFSDFDDFQEAFNDRYNYTMRNI